MDKELVRVLGNVAPADVTKIEKAFQSYDVDNSGMLEGDEVKALSKDILAVVHPDHTEEDVPKFVQLLMSAVDTDGDGKVSRDELTQLVKSLQQ